MRPRHVIRIALIASLFVLAACQEIDPYTRPDTWQPSGANAGNIAAMAANPYDLIHGRGVTRAESKASNVAIDRIWTDIPKGLIDPGGLSGGASGASGGSSGGGSGGGSGKSGG